MDTAAGLTVQWQMNRTRDARVFLLPFFRMTGRNVSCQSDCRTCWRAASTEAFALYVIVAGCGRAPKTFPKRAHKRAFSRLVRII